MNQAEAEAFLIAAGYNPITNDNAEDRVLMVCRQGPVEELRAWLALGVSPNICGDMSSEVPILIAAEHGQAKILDQLRAAGANPLATSKDGKNALFFAIKGDKAKLIEPLLAAGVPLNTLSATHMSPLSEAIYLRKNEIALQLLAAGADPNLGNKFHRSPFSYVRAGMGEVLEAMVKAGGDLNAEVNAYHHTAAMVLVLNGVVRVNDPILQGADKTQANVYGWTLPMCQDWVGSRSSSIEQEFLQSLKKKSLVSKWLTRPDLPLNARDPYGQTALIVLAHQKMWDLCQQLIARGADPSLQANGWSALSWAAEHKQEDMVTLLLERGAPADEVPGSSNALRAAAYNNSEGILARLLQAGASPDGVNAEGETALIRAAAAGRTKCVQLLLAAKASPHIADHQGQTPLIHAALGGHSGVITALLKARADINAQDHEKETAVHKLARESFPKNAHLQSLKALLKANAQLDVRNSQGNTAIKVLLWENEYIPALTEYFQKAPPSYAMLCCAVKVQDLAMARRALGAELSVAERSEPLIDAAQAADLAMVQLLLEYGADPNYAGWNRFTPLIRAAAVGSVEVVTRLLKAGADPNAQTVHDYTALSMAANKNHLAVMELLVAAGAKVQPFPAGDTPLARAISGKAVEAIKWLMAHGADPLTRIPDGHTLREEAAKKGLEGLV